jgi:sialate O-acetylesterase
MNKQALTLLLASIGFTAQATITLPALFNSNMVLQQQADAAIWGSAGKNAPVVITTSWDKKKYTVKADADGKWKTYVHTPKAGGPYDITITDGTPLKLTNVLIGEVWLCSGQSNMEMPVKGFRNQPILGSNDLLMEADDPELRLFRVERAVANTPQTDCKAKWETCSPQSVKEFSAVGYMYAKILRARLKVPVGIMEATWGGTPIEGWMNTNSLKRVPYGIKDAAPGANITRLEPTGLFNGMIAPLAGFALKGVLWYQGETNRDRPELYAGLMQSMVSEWRSLWNIGEWPFYYVQIAPYLYPNGRPLVPYLREAQDKAQALIPNSGMVVVMDAGDEKTIHPANKTVVGNRLAYWALAKTYGREGLNYQSPTYKAMTIVTDTVKVSFNNAANGLTAYGKDITSFELAGNDKVFYPALARLTNEGVFLYSTQVKGPVSVRYAFKDWPQAELFSVEGLPVAPFRTDDWEPKK